MGRVTTCGSFLWIPRVYAEQDDGWIDIMMTLLEIYMEGKSRYVYLLTTSIQIPVNKTIVSSAEK
jgi:hypothetical protein